MLRLCAPERLTADMKLAQFPRSRSRSALRLTIASLWPLAGVLTLLSSLSASEPLAKGIQDNSFFIEEAYNREPAGRSGDMRHHDFRTSTFMALFRTTD